MTPAETRPRCPREPHNADYNHSQPEDRDNPAAGAIGSQAVRPDEPRRRHVTTAEDVHLALADLATLAVLAVPNAASASFTLVAGDSRGRAGDLLGACSDAVARTVDDAQYRAGDGPCLQALGGTEPVSVRDFELDSRWPSVSLEALTVGVRSSLSIPLPGLRDHRGSLNLYSTSPGDLLAEDHNGAGQLTRHVTRHLNQLLDLGDERAGRRHEHQLAHELQRSLLPELPSVPGLDIATRYLAGGDAQVGGDWYDVLPLPDGAVGLAIGDVMGHDIAAAAAMGQLRSVLRSYAFEGHTPAAVLDRLDRLVQGLDMADLATTVYGRLIRDENRDGAMLLYANAGHLPPLVRYPDASVQFLSAAQSVLIGAPTGSPPARGQAAVDLPGGTSLVFYTDGLVEHRNRDLDTGLSQLARATAGIPGQPSADELCEHLLRGLLPAAEAEAGGYSAEDDVAVLVVRLPGPER